MAFADQRILQLLCPLLGGSHGLFLLLFLADQCILQLLPEETAQGLVRGRTPHLPARLATHEAHVEILRLPGTCAPFQCTTLAPSPWGMHVLCMRYSPPWCAPGIPWGDPTPPLVRNNAPANACDTLSPGVVLVHHYSARSPGTRTREWYACLPPVRCAFLVCHLISIGDNICTPAVVQVEFVSADDVREKHFAEGKAPAAFLK